MPDREPTILDEVNEDLHQLQELLSCNADDLAALAKLMKHFIKEKPEEMRQLQARNGKSLTALTSLTDHILTLVQLYAIKEGLRIADILRCADLPIEQYAAAEKRSKAERPDLWESRFTTGQEYRRNVGKQEPEAKKK